MSDQIKIGTWNINGLGNNAEKLRDDDFIKLIENFDIFSLVETWHTSKTKICLKGFDSLDVMRTKKCKRGRNSGGIIVFIKNTIRKGVVQLKSKIQDSMWLKLNRNFFGIQKDLYLCVTYRKPSDLKGCEAYFTALEDEISKFSAQGSVCITGDINARTAVRPDFIETDETLFTDNIFEYKSCNLVRNNLDMKTNAAGLQLLELCKTTDMLILNGRVVGNLAGHFTYYGQNGCSVVDYTLTDTSLFESILYHTIALPTHLSDHSLQKLGIKCNYKKATKDNLTEMLEPLPMKFRWEDNSKVNYPLALLDEASTDKLTEFQFLNFTEDEDGINVRNKKLTEIMINAAKLSLHQKSSKKHRKRRNTWFDKDCCTQKRLFREIQKDLSKDPKNPFLRGRFCKIRKTYKKLLKMKKQEEKDSIISQLSLLRNVNPKLYWQLIEKLKGTDTKDSLVDDINPEEWIAHFKNLSLKSFSDTSIDKEIQEREANNEKHLLDNPITICEIKKCIRKLKNNKTCGEDLIINEMIKSGAYILLPSLCKLFNLVLKTGKFPEKWNINLLSPIWKAGNHFDCNNYRGISISSCLGKLFTSVLQSRLLSYLEDNHKISEKQAAFRPGYSTTDHLFTLKSLINKYINVSKGKLYVCFVDFQKAFDTVWREGLFLKLLRMGITGNFYKLIKHMFLSTNLKIKLPKGLSPKFKSNIGIKQGDGLSPLLFNIFSMI